MSTSILESALAKLRAIANYEWIGKGALNRPQIYDNEAAALLARLSELEEQLSDGNCPVKYYKHGGVTYAVYGTSSINHAEMLLTKIEAARGMVDGCHCATCTCNPGMTPAIRFDTSPAAQEGAIRDHLIALGWTPPGAQHPASTHCDNCGCDWLDNGLNPIGCPYCKQQRGS